MIHVLVSREFPPAPGGGIGTYVTHMVDAYIASGDTVHVITQRWRGAEEPEVTSHDGQLVVHRVPYTAPDALFGVRPHRALAPAALRLFRSAMPAQAFAWGVTAVVERLVEEAAVDVIEAPEFEAPLYFFQRRRAQRLGPARTPPCIIHLHSPTELIARHNGWAASDPLRAASHHVERFSVGAADLVICPSQFLADQASDMFALDQPVQVVRYPMTPTTPINRGDTTWSNGSVLFVGRLEHRKGAAEWIEAAVAIARSRTDIRFAFVGENRLEEHNPGFARLLARIPPDLHSRFAFHGSQGRAGVQALLAEARLVVVPSRWENFPYSCIEAMASGAPVMVAPHGGTREMVEESRTGWIADGGDVASLIAGATRALDAGASGLAAAGHAAALAVGTLCHPAAIVAARRALYGPLLRPDEDRRGRGGQYAELPIDHGITVGATERGSLGSAFAVMARHPVHAMSTIAGRIARRLRTRLRQR